MQRAWIEHDRSVDSRTNVVRAPLLHGGIRRSGSLAVEIPPGRSFSPGRHPAPTRPRAAGRGARPSRAAQRRPPGLAGTPRHRARGGAQTAAPRSARRARSIARRDGAQAQRGRDPYRRDRAERLLAEIRDEVKDAIAEIRRVVDDLRPPAIDEVGLVGAIRQRAEALSSVALQFVVTGPGRAATRAGGGRGRGVPDRLRGDDQRRQALRREPVHRRRRDRRCAGAQRLRQRPGPPGPMGQGVGWTSMSDRAAELGGSCTISAAPTAVWSSAPSSRWREDVHVELKP